MLVSWRKISLICFFALPLLGGRLPRPPQKAKEDSTFIGAALETPFAFVLYLRGTCLLSEVFADMKVVLKSCPGLPGAVHAGWPGPPTLPLPRGPHSGGGGLVGSR